MRLGIQPFLLLLTIQIGCTGMPLFAHPSLPAKVSRNAPTEIHRLRRGVPQFWRQFGDPLLNRLMAEAISSRRTLRSLLSESDKPGPCIEAMNRAHSP